MIATLSRLLTSKEAEETEHTRETRMEKQKNNKPLGVLERLALIAVPILFTALIVADAVHVI